MPLLSSRAQIDTPKFFRSFYRLPTPIPSSYSHPKPGGSPNPCDSALSLFSSILPTHHKANSLHYWMLYPLHLIHLSSSSPWLSFHSGQGAEGLPIRDILIWMNIKNMPIALFLILPHLLTSITDQMCERCVITRFLSEDFIFATLALNKSRM